MTGRPSETIRHEFDRLFGEGTVAGLTDTQLLDRFLARRDDVAFAALVARHGPMVLAVCRGVLTDRDGAEDAFQATFLVLVRKAGSLRVNKSLASWLYRVAYRIAVRADTASRTRRRREKQVAEMRQTQAVPPSDPDLGPVLLEEIDRLPERYRVPVVLCGIEGLTHESAARQLGCPVGTVSGRLSRARDLLRSRLARRGVALPTGLLAVGAAQPASAVPPALAASTVDAAMKAMAHGAISVAVLRLADGAIRSMLMTRLKTATVALAATGLTLLGLGSLAQQSRDTPSNAQAVGKNTAVPPPSVAAPVAASARLLDDAFRLVSTHDDPDNTYTLTAIARAQAKAGDRPAALATLKRAVELAEKGKHGTRCVIMSAVVYAYWEVSDRAAIPALLKDALKDVDGVEDDDKKLAVLSCVGRDLAWTGDIPGARECARRAREIVGNSPTENSRFFRSLKLVELLTQVGDFDDAINVANSIGNSGPLLGIIAATASSANHYVLQPPRELTAAQKETRKEVVHRILKASRNPAAEVAIALGDLGETEEALQVVGDEAWASRPESLWVLSRIAIAQFKLGRPDAASKTIEKALDLVRRFPTLMKSGRHLVASAQAEIGDTNGAFRAIEALDPAERVIPSLSIGEELARQGKHDGARKILTLGLEGARVGLSWLPVDDSPGAMSRRSFLNSLGMWEIATIQARLGDYRKALETAMAVPDYRKGAALIEVAKAQAHAGHADDVMAWARRLDQLKDRASAIQGLAEGLLLRWPAEKTGPDPTR